MHFKPSAGIFVAGLATSFGGGLFVATGIGNSGMAFIGFAASVAGLVMMCIGATRALQIIDALPAAFHNITVGIGQPNQPQHQTYGQQPPVQ